MVPSSSALRAPAPPPDHAPPPPAAERSGAPLARLLSHPLLGPALIVLTCYVVFFANLGGPPLFDPDEGRHAETAREILVTGNWLTLTLNFVPYYDKPILSYWLVAFSMQSFGANEWAVRLPSAVAACVGVAATVWWARRFFDPLTGVLAGLILVTSGGYAGLGRFTITDMVFSAWVITAFFYGSAWLLHGRARGWPPWPAYVLLSLATLTKGPVALVLAALTFGLFLYSGQPRPARRALRLRQGLLIIAALAGTWYAVIAVVDPAYLWKFLWTHNVTRFTEGTGGHRANPFAYLYLLPVVFLPWSLYLPAALLHARDTPPPRVPRASEFCVVWIAAVFVFFSLSSGKLATYLLPLFPPLAVLTAHALAPVVRRLPLRRAERRIHRTVLHALAAVVAVGAIVGLVVVLRYAAHGIGTAVLLLAGTPLLFCGVRALRHQRHDLALAAVFGTALLYLAGSYVVAPAVLEDIFSLKPAARLVRALPPTARVVTHHARSNSLRFYTGRDIAVAATPDDAAAALAAPVSTVLLTKTRLLDALRCHLRAPAYIWWHGQRTKVLVANHAPPAGTDATAIPLLPLPAERCATGSP